MQYPQWVLPSSAGSCDRGSRHRERPKQFVKGDPYEHNTFFSALHLDDELR